MTEEIPVEALEAAAQRFADLHGVYLSGRYGVAEELLAAAQPYLTQHAQAMPSVEDVRAEIAGACIGDAAADRAAERVLALLASQPTVAQAREQVAREVLDYHEDLAHVVYRLNPAHYEDSDGFIHEYPWDWLTTEYQEAMRSEAREYLGEIAHRIAHSETKEDQ